MTSATIMQTAYLTGCAAMSYMPSVADVARDITIRKVGTLAVGTLGIMALDSVPKAEAGPAAEIACMALCSLAAFTPWGAGVYAQCMQACELLGHAPGP